MKRAIASFEQDHEGHWVARLTCGHTQHMRHDPPLTDRPRVLTEAGRSTLIGIELECRTCDEERDRGAHDV
ncbi:MAG TPA: DUF3565 domain-containing protein [Trueperaceae bacterium]|nr:DUF3565 domain-containing protein [Trueperaceae bacterium]